MEEYYIEKVNEDGVFHIHEDYEYWHPVLRKHSAKNGGKDFVQSINGLKRIINKLQEECDEIIFTTNHIKKEEVSIKSDILLSPSPKGVSSSTEARNIICIVCHECLEHANSSSHNNSHLCLCDSCRERIEDCPDENNKVEIVMTRIRLKSIRDGNVCKY